MGRFLPFLLWFALALYACIDCGRTPRDAMPGRLAKPLWFVVIILVPLGLGAIAWIVVKGAQQAEDAERLGRAPGSRGGSGEAAQRGPRRPRPTGPVAPDDDPAFLAQLDQQARARRRTLRQQEQEAARRAETEATGTPEASGDAAEAEDTASGERPGQHPDGDDVADGGLDGRIPRSE